MKSTDFLSELPQSMRERIEAAEAARVNWACPVHELTYGLTGWNCPSCDKAAEEAKRDFEGAWRRYFWWTGHAGVPKRSRCATVDHLVGHSPSTKALAKAAAAYTAQLQARFKAGEGLVLLGPPGLGKTLALTAIINEVCRQGMNGAYRVWPDVLATIKAGFAGPRDDERREAVNELREIRFLALDELGIRAGSEFDHAQLFELIDHRYRERLPTLVAANVTAAEFPQVVGERIADRLRETCATLTLAGTSQRGKQRLEGPDAVPEPPSTMTFRVHRGGEWREVEFDRPDPYFRRYL